jgi:hypothetical protein
MNPKAREDLIRAIFPTAPHSPSNSTLVLNNEVLDVHKNCIVFSQLCISELVPGNKLIDLMDARANPAKEDYLWIYEDYCFVKTLIQRGVLDGN